MNPNGESGPNLGSNSANEALRPQLVQSCVDEAVACARVLRAQEQDIGTTDFALLALAEATDSPEVASVVERDQDRLASLAGIARRTENALLEQSVIAETIERFGEGKSSAPLVDIAAEMRSPHILLAAITDPETYDQAAYAFATRLKSLMLIDQIQDPKRREQAILTIIQGTTREIGPFLDLLDEDQKQQAIWLRAARQEDVELAAAVTDILSRAKLLLEIARSSRNKELAVSVAELLPRINDDDPLRKAACLRDYMELSGSDDQTHNLHATARKIDDRVERAPFLAAVFAKTKDPAVGQEIKDVLGVYGDTLPGDVKDNVLAGLAIGLNDLAQGLLIRNPTLRYDTVRTVIIEAGDVQVARDAASRLQNPGLLHDFAVARNDMNLALEMANSTNNALRINGINAVLELVFNSGNLRPISQITDRVLYEHMIVTYLVGKDNLEVAEKIEDPAIRRKVQIGIATKRGDLELAARLGAWEVVENMERALMTNESTAFPFDKIRLIEDPVQRVYAYFAHPAAAVAEGKAEILACIRQLPENYQPYHLSTLAEATHDPLVAYESLYRIQGAINSIHDIVIVAKMIGLTKGRLLAGS